jgi:hypothetical protein
MYHRRPARAVLHRDQIKAIFVVRTTVSQHPHAGHSGNVALFPPVHRLQPTSACRAATGLHFDEGDRLAPAYDEIHVMASELEAMRFERPSTRGKKCECDAFSLQAEELTLVFPFLDRDKPTM